MRKFLFSLLFSDVCSAGFSQCISHDSAWIRENFYTGYLRYYLREGYIMVTQDVRGRWMSEGQFVDVRPFNKDKTTNSDIDEASDTYDAIDWLVKNLPANNGRVG